MNTLEARRRLLGRNVYKRTTEGNPAIAQGSLARMYPGITMQGWTEQDGTPTPEAPVPIVSAGKYNEETGKWDYEVKLTGANLFKPISNQKGYYTGTLGNIVSLISTRGWSWEIEVYNWIPGQYTISIDTDVNIRYRYYITDDDGVILNLYEDSSANDNHNYKTFELPDGGKKFLLSIIEIDSADEARIMLNVGNKELSYEPYRTPQTVTLTSDRPLTKWDKLEKRNGQWGWVYKSNVHIVNGEENFSIGSNAYVGESTSGVYFVPGDAYGNHNIPNEFCNRLSHVMEIWNKDGEIGFCLNNDQIHMRLSNEVLGVTSDTPYGEVISAFRNYHIQQYEDGNPFIFWYETAEETFVPLSESEQEQMNALYTFRPTTVLSNDCECDMTLTYKTKKSMEVTT